MSKEQENTDRLNTSTGSTRRSASRAEPPPIPSEEQQHTYIEPCQSASTPPALVLPPRAPTSSVVPKKWSSLPPTHTLKDSESKNTYDEVIPVCEQTDQDDRHLYLMFDSKETSARSDTSAQLQMIQEQQTVLCKEFYQFKKDITMEIFSLKEMTEKLTSLVQDSSTNYQTTLETVQFKFLENFDHLGKQILEVRRDIVAAARKQSLPLQKAHPSGHSHVLEWEVINVDSLIKNQKESTSPTYSFHQIGYNIHGGVSCTKDGHFWLKFFWESPPSSRNTLPKNTNFECTVHIVNKSGKHPEWIVGKVAGDVTIGGEWMVGDLLVSEVKKRGYITKTGSINLKFVTEIRD